MSEQSRLAGIKDGVTLAEDEARELWKEFSAHMDANEGDLAGFAKKKGWHSVAPEYRQGKAVLLVRTTEAAPAPPPPPAQARPKAPAKGQPRPAAKGKPKPKPKPKGNAAPAKRGAAPQGNGGTKPRR